MFVVVEIGIEGFVFVVFVDGFFGVLGYVCVG